MTTAIMQQSTRIAVQIIVEDDTGNILTLFMTLVALAGLLAKLGQFINEAMLLVSDVVEAFRFTAAVFTIGFKSLAFGFVGVRL